MDADGCQRQMSASAALGLTKMILKCPIWDSLSDIVLYGIGYTVLYRIDFEILPVLIIPQHREQLKVFAQLVSLQQYSRKQ